MHIFIEAMIFVLFCIYVEVEEFGMQILCFSRIERKQIAFIVFIN